MPEEAVARADEIRLLTEIGFLGIAQGRYAPARRLFEALAVLRPQRDFPWIGLALALYGQGQSTEAVQLLASKTLQSAEDDTNLKAFLGLLLRLVGENGRAEGILHEAAEGKGDAVSLAQVLLRAQQGAQSAEKPAPVPVDVLA